MEMKLLSCCLVFIFFILNHAQAADPLVIPNNRTIQLDRIQKLDQKLESLTSEIKTQKAELKLLKDSITGNFDTDARLIIDNKTEIGNDFALVEARYYLDDHEIALVTNEDSQKPVVYDNFLKEGKHEIKIEKKYTPNHKIFTYMNDQKYLLVGKTNVELKPGNTTYLDVTSYEKKGDKDPLDLKYEIRLVPHTNNGRTLIPVSDVPHLLPGAPMTDTTLVVYASRELEPNLMLKSYEVFLDGKRLTQLPAGTSGPSGLILFEGPAPAGKHTLNATLRFEGMGKPNITSKFKVEITTQPGFKTAIILTHQKKVQVHQEAL
jgi:hypothetical protein